jgi:hypothetical protein
MSPPKVEYVKNGDYVKDPITSFEGTVVSRTEFINGYQRCAVVAPMLAHYNAPRLCSPHARG